MTSSAASGLASYPTNVGSSHRGLLYVYKIQQDIKMKDKNDPARISVYKYRTAG